MRKKRRKQNKKRLIKNEFEWVRPGPIEKSISL